MPRMKILNSTEQEHFDKPPIFNTNERKYFFEFTSDILNAANQLKSPSYKIGFLVSCGYFRVTKKFFNVEDYHSKDIEYVAKILSLKIGNFSTKNYLRSRVHSHRQLILELYGYSQWDKEAETYIAQEISGMVQKQLKPKLIFWSCIDLLIKKRIALPSCFQLSEIIASAFNQNKKDLTSLISRELTDKTSSLLNSLFVQEQNDQEDEKESPYARYKLTLLKQLSQSTKPSKVKEKTDDLVYLKELYTSIEEILPTLNLGYDGIRYYANSVIKSDIFQLNQRSLEDQYLHVIAFIAHQYYRLQDNLADVLLSVMRSYQNSSMREHRDSCYENRKQKDKTFKSSLKAFSNKIFNIFSEIYGIIEDSTLTDTDKVKRIRKLLGFSNAIAEESERLESSLEQRSKDEKSYFDVLEDHSLRLQSRVTPIVKALDFQGEISSTALMEAITYFKEKDGVITKSAPLDFLDNDQRKAVFVKGEFRISLYKVFLFIHIASALKSGTLNLKHSYKYRSLDDYMISKERWRKEKEMLLTKAELTDLANPSTLLDALDKKLHHQYKETNRFHLEGNNPYLKVNKNGDFTINTPKQEENSDSELLQSLFPDQPVALTEVLSTVNRHTKFLEEFQHWQQRYAKNKTTDKTLYAGIIGKGCAIGTPKIARISSEISENNLHNVINWYFSLDNVQAANDRIIKLMDNMELPDIYRKSKDSLHTASDGQKYTVRTESLNANYSFKYFGKEQGVSAYTFIDERNFLWHSLVFSAAERESAYVIDGLMHNDVVRSDIHSTDTHGYSEVIFAITHLLGFSYAPRIKNLKKQILYTFKSRKKSTKKDWGIAPSKYVNRDIIEETWDDVLRLVTTIKLKEYTASEIFRRLNSYSKQHALYKGLKAFGQIIKSQFILRYLSEVELRQAIEKQLNKVELANRFSRAVAVGDPRGFTQGEKEEQEIAESCNRLIKNAIICWNYIYLSDKTVRLKKQPEQQQVLLSSIATHSPISWAHVNLLGEYDFSDKRLKDSFKLKAPKLIA